MKEKFRRMNNVDSTAGVVTQLEKVDSNQLTELETNCVIQPSPLCLRLLVSLATRIFGKPRWSMRPRLSGRARPASNPCDSSAAAAECNIIICGCLTRTEQGLAQWHLDWFRAGSVHVVTSADMMTNMTVIRFCSVWSHLAPCVGYSCSWLECKPCLSSSASSLLCWTVASCSAYFAFASFTFDKITLTLSDSLITLA